MKVAGAAMDGEEEEEEGEEEGEEEEGEEGDWGELRICLLDRPPFTHLRRRGS